MCIRDSDKPGREGFRRGVTEGDISPRAMRNATFTLLALDCLIGLSLIIWGGWWLIFVGIAIAIFALAYSTGPWPLSHHGLGEVAVIIFFGIIPVIFTAYVETGNWKMMPVAFPMSMAIGLLGANVLIVNNYRDREDDAKVGKRTLAVIFGPKAIAGLYLVNGFLALLFIEIATAIRIPVLWQIVPLLFINQHYLLWRELRESHGAECNPLLGKTALTMLAVAIWALLAFTLSPSA